MTDKTLREIQTTLPWTIKYSEDYRRNPQPHKDFTHALLHVSKAAGHLNGLADDMDHNRATALDPGLREKYGKYVADFVICAVRIANVFPGGMLDLQTLVQERIALKNAPPTTREAVLEAGAEIHDRIAANNRTTSAPEKDTIWVGRDGQRRRVLSCDRGPASSDPWMIHYVNLSVERADNEYREDSGEWFRWVTETDARIEARTEEPMKTDAEEKSQAYVPGEDDDAMDRAAIAFMRAYDEREREREGQHYARPPYSLEEWHDNATAEHRVVVCGVDEDGFEVMTGPTQDGEEPQPKVSYYSNLYPGQAQFETPSEWLEWSARTKAVLWKKCPKWEYPEVGITYESADGKERRRVTGCGRQPWHRHETRVSWRRLLPPEEKESWHELNGWRAWAIKTKARRVPTEKAEQPKKAVSPKPGDVFFNEKLQTVYAVTDVKNDVDLGPQVSYRTEPSGKSTVESLSLWRELITEAVPVQWSRGTRLFPTPGGRYLSKFPASTPLTVTRVETNPWIVTYRSEDGNCSQITLADWDGWVGRAEVSRIE